jgi:hypothetical protein
VQAPQDTHDGTCDLFPGRRHRRPTTEPPICFPDGASEDPRRDRRFVSRTAPQKTHDGTADLFPGRRLRRPTTERAICFPDGASEDPRRNRRFVSRTARREAHDGGWGLFPGPRVRRNSTTGRTGARAFAVSAESHAGSPCLLRSSWGATVSHDLEDRSRGVMRWNYYVPHEWESPDDRHTWEDVYLRAEDDDGPSMWLTVDAGGDDEQLAKRVAFYGDRLTHSPAAYYLGRWLKARGIELFVFPDLDIEIRPADVNLGELLEVVKAFLTAFIGDPDPELVPGSLEDFAGSNQHAQTVARAKEKLGRHSCEDHPSP